VNVGVLCAALGSPVKGGATAWRTVRAIDILIVVTVDHAPGGSELRMRSSTGVGCAVAGHIVAGGPWLGTAFTYTFYAAPDSVFMVACLTVFLELMLFVACLALGIGLLRSRWRQFGIGLLRVHSGVGFDLRV